MYITQRITKKWCHFAKLIISLNVLLLNVTRRWTFNAVPAPHLLSLFLTRQPYPPWKSDCSFRYSSLWNQLPDSFRQPHQSCLDSPPHPLINSSIIIPSSRHPSLLLSFTPGSKSTLSTNLSHRRFLLPTGLPHDNGTGPDLLCSSLYF